MNQIIDPSKSVQVDMSKAIPFLPILPMDLLRDLLAAFALMGMCVESEDTGVREHNVDYFAKSAYQVADAMLKAREKKD